MAPISPTYSTITNVPNLIQLSGSSTITVTIKNTANMPVNNAYVTVYKKVGTSGSWGVYSTGSTNISGVLTRTFIGDNPTNTWRYFTASASWSGSYVALATQSQVYVQP